MHEIIFDDTIRQGKDLLSKSEPGPYKDTLKSDLKDLETRWDDVLQKTNDRQEQLDEVTPPAQEYTEAMENFTPALVEMEEIVSECDEVLCQKHALERERALIKVC
jgi:chemotaxis regulatin CheY-phosphate phosphatase CheZ